MTSSFSTSCLRFLSTSNTHFSASLASPLAPQVKVTPLHGPKDASPRFDVCQESGCPQFRRHGVTQAFDDDCYEKLWIKTVNAEWRKIIEGHPPALTLFYGPFPYEQFGAAFDFFESLVEGSSGRCSYRIDDAECELAKCHCVDVSPGYCMLGAKVAGFTLRLPSTIGPAIDPHLIVAEINWQARVGHRSFEPSYALGA